ncbi:hypothetical protein [Tomitella biformata]|uniref:hypothetical protein n=1 Tax=Tomitella biformata TaxID=630403 RepID=UPI0004BC2F19|nr:hypothetical protein [Tomitella biformata]
MNPVKRNFGGHRARQIGIGVVAAAAAVVMSGATAGVANANVGDSLPAECLQFSRDAGVNWDDQGPKFNSIRPVPGYEELWAEFENRNNCDIPAKLVYFSQDWKVGKGATATLRVNLDGVEGQQVVIGPDNPDTYIVLNESGTLATDEAVAVEWLIGIPWEETQQGGSINPGMGIDLIQSAPLAPSDLVIDPEAPAAGDVIMVRGTAEPGVSVSVRVDGDEKCVAATDQAGAFSCEIGALAPGAHQVSAVATDSGVESEPAEPIDVTVGPGVSGSPGSLGSAGSVGSSIGFGSLIDLGSSS